MKLSSFLGLLFAFLFIGKLSTHGQQDSPQQPIISPEQIASSFGYTGKLKVQDFASLGLAKPNVVQELNFTADDSTFLPTNIKVMTAGTALTTQQLTAFEKTASSSSPPSYFKVVTLSDGTIAYLLSLGGPGGGGCEALMSSKDGRFDLIVSFAALIDTTYEQTNFNRDYYEKMLGTKADPLAALAGALPQIYSAVSSNYEKIAGKKSNSANASATSSTNPQSTNSAPSQLPTAAGSSTQAQSAPPSAAIESKTPLWIYPIIALIVSLIVVLWYRSRSKK